MFKIKSNVQQWRDSLRSKTRKVESSVKYALDDVDAVKVVQESYDESPLRVRSGRLYNSFTVKEEVGGLKRTIGSDVPYARIQDQGGYTGRGHKTFIKPTFYFTRAIPKLKASLKDKLRNFINKTFGI